MNKFQLLENQQSKLFLHENIVDILFRHKNEISRTLSDIKGLYCIDHIAINMVSPSKEVVIFSITPSVEYNLFAHELWRYDQSFSPLFFKDKSLFWWEQGYNPNYFNDLKNLKEKKHNFSLGFNLVRKINQFQIVYSFATRSPKKDLPAYYQELEPQLFLLGDYGYKLIESIYEKYCDHNIPSLVNKNINNKKIASSLKLIVNNVL